jgi:hypothetical protein
MALVGLRLFQEAMSGTKLKVHFCGDQMDLVLLLLYMSINHFCSSH